MKGSKIVSAVGKLLLVVGSLTLSLLAVEFSIRALDLFPRERQATVTPFGDLQDAVEPLAGARAFKRVPHPFTGWVDSPSLPDHNIFGLVSEIEDYRQLPEEDFVVAITGGSVALGMVRKARSALVSRLERLQPGLQGRIEVLNLSLGGFKQPQQLFLAQQFLLLGVPIDVLVNVDGFNEIALGSRSAKRGSHPIFPNEFYWSTTLDLAGRQLTEEQILLAAGGLRARRQAHRLRSALQESSRLACSQLVLAVSGAYLMRLESRAVAAQEALYDSSSAKRAEVIQSLGDPCLETREGCFELIADIWVDTSTTLDSICDQFGLLYLHVLQPNQYFEGSKELTEDELSLAWDPEHPWSQAARSGYPLLVDRGLALQRRGVDFHDMTELFADQLETIYSDSCCHYNDRGYRLLAEAIAEKISAALDQR